MRLESVLTVCVWLFFQLFTKGKAWSPPCSSLMISGDSEIINDLDFDVTCGEKTVYHYTLRSNSTVQSLTIDYTCYYTNGSLFSEPTVGLLVQGEEYVKLDANKDIPQDPLPISDLVYCQFSGCVFIDDHGWHNISDTDVCRLESVQQLSTGTMTLSPSATEMNITSSLTTSLIPGIDITSTSSAVQQLSTGTMTLSPLATEMSITSSLTTSFILGIDITSTSSVITTSTQAMVTNSPSATDVSRNITVTIVTIVIVILIVFIGGISLAALLISCLTLWKRRLSLGKDIFFLEDENQVNSQHKPESNGVQSFSFYTLSSTSTSSSLVTILNSLEMTSVTAESDYSSVKRDDTLSLAELNRLQTELVEYEDNAPDSSNSKSIMQAFDSSDINNSNKTIVQSSSALEVCTDETNNDLRDHSSCDGYVRYSIQYAENTCDDYIPNQSPSNITCANTSPTNPSNELSSRPFQNYETESTHIEFPSSISNYCPSDCYISSDSSNVTWDSAYYSDSSNYYYSNTPVYLKNDNDFENEEYDFCAEDNIINGTSLNNSEADFEHISRKVCQNYMTEIPVTIMK